MTDSLHFRQDELLERFEHDWRSAPPASLYQYINEASQDASATFELLTTDMEYRWRSQHGSLRDQLGCNPRIEDYARQLSEWAIPVAITSLWVAEEYRVRRIWGDQPSHPHFVQRFPDLGDELLVALGCTDHDLEKERVQVGPLRDHEFDATAPLRYQDFEILGLLGAGSMGKVYRVRQKSLKRLVAMKALHKSWQVDDWAVDLFLREGQVLARLDHPGIVKVFGMGRFPNGGYFQILEFVDGQTLRQRIGKSGSEPLHLKEIQDIVAQVADAIAYAHQRDVIHCDLKPENVLLGQGRRVIVSDFGLARMRLRGDISPVAGGTPPYMAPELLGGELPTSAIDVYGIGCVLRELLEHWTNLPVPETLSSLKMLAEECTSAEASERPSASHVADQLRSLPAT